MRFKATLLAIALAASVGCGGSDKGKNTESNGPKKVTDKQELEKLEKLSAEIPSQVITRVPVIDGKPQLHKVEAIRVSKSIDTSDVKAMDAAFEGATAEERLTLNVSDDLNKDSSSDQYCGGGCCGGCCGGGCYRRGFFLNWLTGPVSNCYLGYGAGFGGYYRPFYRMGAYCQVWAPGCGGFGGYTQQSYQSYSTFSSGAGVPGGYVGGVAPVAPVAPIAPVAPGVGAGEWYQGN